MPIEIIDVDDPEIVITKHTFAVPEDDSDVVYRRNQATSRPQYPWGQPGSSSGSQVMSHIREIIATHDQQTRFVNPRKRASGSALTDAPPRKQQRTSTTIATTAPKLDQATSSGTNKSNNIADQLKASAKDSASSSKAVAKRKESEVIDLCTSSDEDVKPTIKKPKLSKKASALLPIPTSKDAVHVKVEPPDSESDYDDVHAGLDLRDDLNWMSLPKHDTDDLTSSLDIMSLAPSSDVDPHAFRGTFDPPRLLLDVNPWDGRYFWTALRKSIHRPPTITRRRHRRFEDKHCPLSAIKIDNLQAEFNTLSLRSTYRKSSGPINRISQHGSTIAICSATFGGNFDDGSEARNPHNKANSLMVCRDNQLRTCRRLGHNSDLCDGIEKYYTVNDVKFDPNCPKRMVSSGNDRTVRVWEHVDTYDGFDMYENTSSEDVPDSLPAAVDLIYTLRYSQPPHDIAYQLPKHGNNCQSVLAVACRNGNLYTYSAHGDPESETVFAIAPAKTNHSVGAIAWGREQTSSYLFASSEPSDTSDNSGAHRAVDIHEGKISYNFSAKEAGDAMAVDDLGQRLALFTRGSSEANILRIYDIDRKNGRQPISTIDLEIFAEDGEDGEVNYTTFSPDGIYLAVARNDNVVHVYDSRNLERGFLHSFKHYYPNREVAGFKGFGVVEAQWVTSFDGRGLGLISGGNDGCVRLWDIGQATDSPANGRVIAETDFDIAHFSIGDKWKGEAPLVVGDSGGGISIFDHLGNKF